MSTPAGVPDPGLQGWEAHRDAELRGQYHEYRERQARGLVRMLPQDAVRPLYRRALSEFGGDSTAPSDPLALLVAYCERLLPLPPFETWRHDAGSHPEAHLRALDDSAQVPTVDRPATVEVRAFPRGEGTWMAYLRAFRDGSVWRGYIAFHASPGSRAVYRTALIFRESSSVELRERFLSFDSVALDAFLRSSLP